MITQLVTLTATELKPPTMDWSVEDILKEFTVFKTLTKMWLETKGVPDQKLYKFILQLLGKEGLHHWESFQPAAPNSNEKNSHTIYAKPWRLIQANCKFQKLQGADLEWLPPTGKWVHCLSAHHLDCLLDKCNYNQCCMNAPKVHLFIRAVKYLAIRFWVRKKPAD